MVKLENNAYDKIMAKLTQARSMARIVLGNALHEDNGFGEPFLTLREIGDLADIIDDLIEESVKELQNYATLSEKERGSQNA